MPIVAPLLLAHLLLTPSQAETYPKGEQARSLEECFEGLKTAVRDNRNAGIIEHANAIGRFGPRAAVAIPWLFQCLEQPQWGFDGSLGSSGSYVVATVVYALRQIGPRGCLELPDAGRWIAWRGWDLAAPLADTTAELLELTEHPVEEVRQLAASQLARLEPSAFEVLLARLTDGDLERRIHAATAVGAFRAPDARLVRSLARCLDAEDRRLRFHACETLGKLMPTSVPSLITALGNDDARVRRSALFALEQWLDARFAVSPLPDLEIGGYGCYEWGVPVRRRARLTREGNLDAIAACLDDPMVENRVICLMILAKLGQAPSNVIDRIRMAAEGDNAGVQVWAKHVLRRVKPSGWEMLEDLRSMVGSDAAVGHHTLDDLASGMDAGEPFEPVVENHEWELPKKGDPRYEAARELVRHFLPELIERAQALDPEALRILDRAQEVVERHVRTLIAVASDEFYGNQAGELLSAVGPAACEQVSAGWLAGFWEFCGGSEEVVFEELGEVLPAFGKGAIPVLTIGMQHEWCYAQCARFLSSIEGAAAPAAPALTRAWQAPRSVVSGGWGDDWECVPRWPDNPERLDWLEIVCRGMGPELIPGLLAALGDEHAIVRMRACRGLAALQASSEEVVAVLTAALADDQAHVRFAAARALQSLLPVDAPLHQRSAAILATFGERP